MPNTDRLHWLLIIVLLGLALNLSAQPPDSALAKAEASEVTDAETPDPVEALLKATHALKKARPELFGEAAGVLITRVLENGQGAAAGLMPGDILIGYGDSLLNSGGQLVALTGATPEDRPVVLRYLRGAEVREISLHGGRIGVMIRGLAETVTADRIQQLLDQANDAYFGARYAEALALYEQGLKLAESQRHRHAEVVFRTNIATLYWELGRHDDSLTYSEAALVIHRATNDRHAEGVVLGNIGSVYSDLGLYEQALEQHQQALAIARENGDRQGEGGTLNNIGSVYHDRGQYHEAIDYYRRALDIHREIGDRRYEGATIGNIAKVYSNLGRYEEALDYHEQALAISLETNNRAGEGSNLNGIGSALDSLGRYEEALDYARRALAIHRGISNSKGESSALSNLADIYADFGRYQEALKHHQQALAIDRETGYRLGEGSNLTNSGFVYYRLVRYQDALDQFERALAIQRAINDRQGEGATLANMGIVYNDIHRHEEALLYYQKAIGIQRAIGDRQNEGNNLTNLARVYAELGRYHEAQTHHQQALVLKRELGDHAGEALDLLNLGVLCSEQGDTVQALRHYQHALAIQVEVGSPETSWRLWSNLRQHWSDQDQPGPAIVAGKRAVNTIQAMRAASGGLDRALQKGFLETKEHVYRGLADDLIGQGRIPEAEQVLAMLKEEELHDFIRRDSSDDQRTTRADLTPAEQAWNTRYERIGAELARIGKEYAALDRIADPTDAEQTRFDTLEAELDTARAALLAIVTALATEFAEQGGAAAGALGKQQLDWLEAQQRTLKRLGHGAALISTVVTKDRLHLILTTPEVQLARQSPIGAAALNTLIGDLRKALTDPRSDLAQDLLPLARRLHDHLLGPIAEDLKQAGSHTLMWSLDGALRYVPLAALHDGEHWLIERYPLVLYTAAARDNLGSDSDAQWRVAGFGVSRAHSLERDGERNDFSALDAVPGELDGIVKEHAEDPGVIAGQVHLDAAFDARRLKQVIRQGFPVLHIASHFRLNPGDNSTSYLLLGDGSALTLADFHAKRAFELDAVDQLTLSACNTAMGNPERAGSGAEVESFGALAQKRGAKGVLATLWPVADQSTGQLMQTLYRLRGEDASMTKAEALRQAQLSLLRGSDPAQPCGAARGPVSLSGEDVETDRPPADPACRYAHPYYWAPFILMGNWL